ncbi:DUF6545 domain-containing protein [Nocardia blacklockiae]|uniref:DUF6545 domain-containing protein n=1 Tax=Nocardia blacklockiae TaxID=480036 RepID=UPI001895E536|nr:DUF6545 domain-containing protein [Nocardia blacklockiae]MBF6171152.1 hypothetical protein [Nocardia blacklockiae]
MLLMVVPAVMRIVLVRRESEVDHLVNMMQLVCAIGVLMREPSIGRGFARFVPGGLPVVFDLWHWTQVLSWTCGMGIWLLIREFGPIRYKAPFRATAFFAAAVGVAFLLLSSPARAQGISIADYGGWRWGAYLALLFVLPVIVSVYQIRTMLSLRHIATAQRELLAVAVAFIVAVLSIVPIVLFVFFAGLSASGVAPEFARSGYSVISDGLASGEPQLMIGAVLALMVVPSCARGLQRAVLRIRLYPIWRELTSAAPSVVLSLRLRDRWGSTPVERLERLRIEIRDAWQIIASTVPVVPHHPGNPITALAVDDGDRKALDDIVAVRRAILQRRANGALDDVSVAAMPVLPEERTLLRLWWAAGAVARAASKPAASQAVRRS